MAAKSKRATGKTKARERKIDEQEIESFPASDPPSYAGGRHAIGAPKNRRTPQRKKKK